MSAARYQTVPTDDHEAKFAASDASPEALHAKLQQDPRFNQPAPAPWKRALLLLFLLALLYLGLHLRLQSPAETKVVHAQRYSKDYKFRPAASPVVTEKLKDGRVRVRGAQPTYAAAPVKETAKDKRGGKGRKGKKGKKAARSSL
ncbi:hypothetical protein OE88DRAFT_784501 [Heliocybe sulcata]|uniref:Uncharacterized protein n=1 Tax=Heliocybe sulcata TaxID=5364 RepID=A0A5C3MQV7_9AGAM|nr:hypothetical protein OE88DRAFT_784501 [Heliocybe sulcata]